MAQVVEHLLSKKKFKSQYCQKKKKKKTRKKRKEKYLVNLVTVLVRLEGNWQCRLILKSSGVQRAEAMWPRQMANE
jgi:hypothetical protein